MDNQTPIECCPKCGRSSNLRSKTLLIGKESPRKKFGPEQRCGYRRPDQLAVDEVLPDALQTEPLSQFIEGFYCDACGIGFVPDTVLAPKPAPGT